MDIVFIIIYFIFGAIMASFFHVVATRLSTGQSIISPPSHCTYCNHKLSWYELIPIVSYISFKGKCHHCHHRLPVSYLLIEIITGILYAVNYHVFGLTLQGLISLIFISTNFNLSVTLCVPPPLSRGGKQFDYINSKPLSYTIN